MKNRYTYFSSASLNHFRSKTMPQSSVCRGGERQGTRAGRTSSRDFHNHSKRVFVDVRFQRESYVFSSTHLCHIFYKKKKLQFWYRRRFRYLYKSCSSNRLVASLRSIILIAIFKLMSQLWKSVLQMRVDWRIRHNFHCSLINVLYRLFRVKKKDGTDRY